MTLGENKPWLVGHPTLTFLWIYICPFFIAYVLFISQSYLLVPFKQAPYENKLRVEIFDGYYKLKPGSYFNQRYGVSYSVNRDGFRRVPFSENCSKYEVMTLGESSTVGLEVSDDDTWPAKLVALGFSTCLLNAGIGGSNSSNHVNLLAKEFDHNLPGLFIYYAGRNDHGLGFGTERYPGPELHPEGFWNWFKQYLIFKKAQFRAVQLKIFGTELIDFFPKVNNWTTLYQANLENIILFCNARNTRITIVQQLMPFGRKVVAKINANQFDEARSIVAFSEPAWPELLRQIDLYEVQLAISQKHDVQFVRTLDDLPEDRSELFFDTVHLTEKGNRYLAEHVAASLKAP